MLKKVAAAFAESPLIRHGRRLWLENTRNWNLPLNKLQKLAAGAYIILRDYADGRFPPTFEDQQRAYDAEVDYRNSLPGLTPEQVRTFDMQKPFWYGPKTRYYFRQFIEVTEAFLKCGVKPGARLLELGCGTGWMAEFLALMGFDCLGTTISPEDVKDALLRRQSIEIKGLPARLDYKVSPMESVAENLKNEGRFDVVFIFEALHHAYDWRQTIRSAYDCVKPGGLFFLFHEPNRIHTAVSYRMARLSNTHEIGFRPAALVRQMRDAGFRDVRYLKNRFHFFIRPLTIVGGRPE